MTQVVELIRSGRAAEGRDLQLARATPLADRLERLTNELVNKAESDMVASIEATHDAYSTSRHAVIAFVVASILLALLLGYSISSSIIGPVRQMEARMAEIAAGDFSKQVRGAQPRRAGRTGRGPEPDERRARAGASASWRPPASTSPSSWPTCRTSCARRSTPSSASPRC